MLFPIGGENSAAADCLVLDAPNDGLSDAQPAVADFLTRLMASPVRRGYIPIGTYRLDSPLPDIAAPINLFGDCNPRTVLLRNHNGTPGKGILTIMPGTHGCVLSHFCLTAAPGTSGGAGLAILASATQNSDRHLLDSLLLSASTDLWTNSLLVDGSLKTSSPVGIRALKIRDCDIFGASGYAAVFNNAPGTTWVGGGLYPAGGSSGLYYTYSSYLPKIRAVTSIADAG